jgi:microcystin-dependent protein
MAASASVTYNFVAGTPSVADNVDQNFADLVTWINTNAVHLDGSKAFTAVPSGPATDPVSANELARKAYVDAVLPIGIIQAFAGSAAPSANWLLCQGQAVSRSTYSSLFGLVGTTYGVGDGSTTFNIPNLSGRVPVGRDAGQAEFDTLGETGGAKTHTLVTGEIPAHQHDIQHGHSGSGSVSGTVTVNDDTTDLVTRLTTLSDGDFVTGIATTPWNAFSPPAMLQSALSSTNPLVGMAVSYILQHGHTASFSGSVSVTVNPLAAGNLSQPTGGNGAHNNLQPYIVLTYIIKVL